MLTTKSIVLKATEVTTEKLNELLAQGYEIKEKIRQADGTDSLILTGKVRQEGSTPIQREMMEAQADAAGRQPVEDAKAIGASIDRAQQHATDTKADLTRSFKKSGKT